MKRFLASAALSLIATAATAQSVDLQVVSRIRQEGFRNSKVMDYARGLTDLIGPRLTGSPEMRKANEWTRDQLTQAGLSNARLHPFEFGRGWSAERLVVRMTTPQEQQLYGLPMAWSPSTDGVIRGNVVRAQLETVEDLEKNKGKFAGAILLNGEARDMRPQEKGALDRYDDEELSELSLYEIPDAANPRREQWLKRREFRAKLAAFLQEEKVAAFVTSANGEGGVFRVQASGSHKPDEAEGVPSIGLAPEHFARISRLLDDEQEVGLEIDLRTRFYVDDPTAWNTIAEIPGSDRRGEVVMLGAHLDSWHTGTGATDNAAGVAAVMEAVRIIKALGRTPKRTIRIALWSGEEQGLLGSRAYVAEHVAARTEPTDPEQAKLPTWARTEKGSLIRKPQYEKISAYFNMDNGTGKIRGIYAQENAAVVPIFAAWLAPLHDLGATTVTMRTTGSTDHVPFDEVGVPGFQFIQDNVEYFTRTHHTNWDTFERLQRDDLMQAAVVIANFVWNAANRDEMLPRKHVE